MRWNEDTGPDDAPERADGPDDHWLALQRGARVLLLHPCGRARSGTVDEMTDDKTTVWVGLDDGLGRTLVHFQDGIRLETRA